MNKSYLETINHLVPKHKYDATVIDLFAGCGGLSLGFEAFGFKTVGYEYIDTFAESYRVINSHFPAPLHLFP